VNVVIDRSRQHGADRGRPQVPPSQRVGQGPRRLQRRALEHSGSAQQGHKQRDPREVQRECDRPKPSHGAPRGPSGQDGRHRDQEVLGEQLRSADRQEDESDAEGERAEHVRGVLRHHLGEGPGGHHEREQAQRHVEAAEQTGRREDGHRPGQAALTIFEAFLPDLTRLATDHGRRS